MHSTGSCICDRAQALVGAPRPPERLVGRLTSLAPSFFVFILKFFKIITDMCLLKPNNQDFDNFSRFKGFLLADEDDCVENCKRRAPPVRVFVMSENE